MTTIDTPAKPQRLMSLDAFRGMTIAGMLLVNNPGTWSTMYWPLGHARWNGWTFTDLIFPFFLFIMGAAMAFSFAKRVESGADTGHLLGHVLRRSLALIALGFMGACGYFLPRHDDGIFAAWREAGQIGAALSVGLMLVWLAGVVLLTGSKRPLVWGAVLGIGLAMAVAAMIFVGPEHPLIQRILRARWPGVLVRIGVCYFLASLIIFKVKTPRAIATTAAVLLVLYFIWSVYIPIPGYGRPDLSIPVEVVGSSDFSGEFSNWEVFYDTALFGIHNYQTIPRKAEVTEENPLWWGFDPEGSLSTIGALCSVLLGYLTGLWLRRTDKSSDAKTLGMFVAGNWLLIAGLVWSIWFPINKKIWTSSYVLFMAGFGLVVLAMCYHVIDVKGWRKWAMPFVWFGTNAIAAFYFSGIFATLLGQFKVMGVNTDGTTGMMGLNSFYYSTVLLSAFDPVNASLLYAITFVLIWTGIMGLFYRAGIFLKI